ncbi:MAG: hypothetical protein IJA67_11375 [Oscillospiraceae bacterium]|nr:hypothetical protein [Oscillospiraceae bacterium]
MKKRMTIICMVLLLCLSLCACTEVQTEKGDEIKAHCEDMIDAILAGDKDAIRAMIPTDEIDDAALQDFYDNVIPYLEGVETYTLKQVGWHVVTKNGITQYQINFEMTTNAEDYYVLGVMNDDYDGLVHFNITSYKDLEAADALPHTGTLTTLAGSNALQWALLVLSAAVLVFTVVIFIDCCRQSIKRKWLWLLFIALGAFIFTVTYQNGHLSAHFNIGVYPMLYSHLKLTATSAFQLQLVVPLGAVVYLIRRSRLLAAAAEPSTEAPAEENLTEEPAEHETAENEPPIE